MYGLSQSITLNYMEQMDEMALRGITLPVQYITSDYRVVNSAPITEFEPIDAEPRLVVNFEPRHINDFKIFQPVERVKEILVEPASVDDMLAEILKQQAPRQREIRDRMLKDVNYGQKTIHAQILTVAA